MIKRLLILIGVGCLIAGIVYRELLVYAFDQAKGQAKVLLRAQPLAEFERNAKIQPGMIANLKLIPAIKDFGMKTLGLENTENYTKVYDQDGKPVLWVVTACEPYQFKSKTWTFPFVGTVSYKGYFRLDKTLKLRDELKEAGYETYIREVDAWSTLGWFKDPLMSETLKNPVGEFANTLLHELTHATIFVKDSLEFNENLASFIGSKGAEQFLIETYGQESEEFQYYVEQKKDRNKFLDHLIWGTQGLDSLYSTFEMSDSIGYKELLKAEYIRQMVNSIDTISFATMNFDNYFKTSLPNNAYFSSFLLYRSLQPLLDSLFQGQFEGNLKSMVEYFKQHHGK